ncbi:MAG: carbohydrate kinase family protein [Clostridia bacterium]|nr:carbohydrate kinase family protein [Clostridia bacterium]
MNYVAGIGGANMDFHAQSRDELVLRDSNPGRLHMSMGGVCRNICENLARLGENVWLCTVLGNDMNGRNILEGCERTGIHMEGTQVLDGEQTSMYISVMDRDGDMLLALSDMHIIKRLDDRLVDQAHNILCGAELVVCDGNLSPRSLERLTTVCPGPLYMDPVSTAWAREVKPFIGFFDTVKPNRMELEILTDCPCGTLEELQMACDVLRGRGVRRVFVSLGREGMFYRGPEGTIIGENRPYPRLVNATGAGDAAMAGIIYATIHGWDPEKVVHAGMAAGMAAIAAEDTINPDISGEMIEKLIKECIE